MNLYVNYDHNTDGQGTDKELGLFHDELLRQYDGDIDTLAADLDALKNGGDCDRYENAENAAMSVAFADWAIFPDSMALSVEVG